MNGFINLLKPPGISSGGAVSFIKRLTGEKVGHAGTLDPEAAGVLPIMVGRATRLLPFFSGGTKEYIAEIAFIGATDTQDAQGRIVIPGKGIPSKETLIGVFPAFTGDIIQIPPDYSAIKKDGVPLYKLARQGKTSLASGRKTRIMEIEYLSATEKGAMIRVLCGSGTYIRTLCHDIGLAIDRPAHMRFLLRTRVGDFSLQDAFTMEQLQEFVRNGDIGCALLPMDMPLSHLRALHLESGFAKLVCNGVPVANPLPDVKEGDFLRIYIDGGFCAVGKACADARIEMQVVVDPYRKA